MKDLQKIDLATKIFFIVAIAIPSLEAAAKKSRKTH